MIKDLKLAFRKVKSALMRRGRTEPDADDLVQEAWIRLAAYERKQVVHEPEAFLMRTALNLHIDMHRCRQARGEDVMVEDVVVIDLSPSPEDVLAARETVARMSHCISRLSDATREIFIAHRIEGLTYREVAEQRNITISTVEKHIARATTQLTAWMEGW